MHVKFSFLTLLSGLASAWAQPQVTVATNPPGIQIIVDGVSYLSPRVFSWEANSTHTIGAVSSLTASGVRQTFQSWSDGGPQTHAVTIGSGNATYTAAFAQFYLLTASTSPAGVGAIIATPDSPDGFYAPGSVVQLEALAPAGYAFQSWSGDASGTNRNFTLTMTAPRGVAAAFTPLLSPVTIQTSPPGLTIAVDGFNYTAPKTFDWVAESSHTIAAMTPQGGAATRYAFTAWSDGGAASHPVVAPSTATTYTAVFRAQHKLAVSVSAGTGTVAASPDAADGYYDAGAVVRLTPLPGAGFQLAAWGGDVSGNASPLEVYLTAPRNVSAAFGPASPCAYSLGSPATSVSPSGDIRAVNVKAGTGCAWQAASNIPWISVVSGVSGAGNGVVRLRIEPNPNGAPRAATITLASVPYTINQPAAGCQVGLSGPDQTLAAAAALNQLNITANSGCQWTASVSPSWVTLPGVSAGSGSGSIAFSTATNQDASPRTGSVVVGGQWFPLIQKNLAPVEQFTDVPAGYLFFDAISLLKLNRITPGCGGTMYCPEAPMTRAEMAAFLVRALYGENFSFASQPSFADVGPDHPYFAYIQKLSEIGVTNGCTAETYCPDAAVTRGQMAAFVVRARLGITFADTFPYPSAALFDDVPVSNIFFPYVQKMKELGITSGCTAAQYCPNGINTRGQMAVFLTRAFLTP